MKMKNNAEKSAALWLESATRKPRFFWQVSASAFAILKSVLVTRY